MVKELLLLSAINDLSSSKTEVSKFATLSLHWQKHIASCKAWSNAKLKKFLDKGAYIKYVGGGAGEFYKFFKKFFVAQETIGLNISWPRNFFKKYFMAPPINYSFLLKAYL